MRRAVGAAHVVGHDLETRDRVGVGVIGEQQVAVLLVGVRLLRVLLDADHAPPDRAGRLAQRALEGEVRLGRGRDVLLERVVVEVLVAVGEVRARDPRGRAGAAQIVLDPDLPALRAEAAGDPVELGVALDPRVMAREVPGLLGEILDRDVLELRRLPDEQLDDARSSSREAPGRRMRTPRSARSCDAPRRRPAAGRRARHRRRCSRTRTYERLLEHDAPRDLHEQPVPPERRVVRRKISRPSRPASRAGDRPRRGSSKRTPSGASQISIPLSETSAIAGDVEIDKLNRGAGRAVAARRSRTPPGSKSERSVKRQDSSVVVGRGSSAKRAAACALANPAGLAGRVGFSADAAS